MDDAPKKRNRLTAGDTPNDVQNDSSPAIVDDVTIKLLSDAFEVIENDPNPTSIKMYTVDDHKEDDWRQIARRNIIYTEYIGNYSSNYTKRSRQLLVLRYWLFIIVIGVLIALVVLCCVTVYSVIQKDVSPSSAGDVVSIIATMVSAITAFLVLPKIITENLFPPKEESQSANIFTSMFNSDISLRDFHDKGRGNLKKAETADRDTTDT